ncbi:MAG: TfoX/Sxy family protein [Verrucomicrobia subdivision 3 bacterium]|nr:TfoX/Sxy family protein [Limisphaerales bacterium]
MADDSFKDFVLDQLAGLPELRARAMFGAHGLYSADRFFAILDEGRVFFKVDETTRAAYASRGMKPFTYEMKGRLMTMSYSEVPPEILEDRNEALAWANLAIQVAAAKPAKKRVLRKQS